MLTRLAYAYVYLLVCLAALLLLLLLTIHIVLLAGGQFQTGGRLFGFFFAINVAIIGLAQDRNIWAHELKSCPRWLRIAFPLLFVYSIVMGLLGVVFEPPITPWSWDVSISSFMLMFTVGSSCVLCATIRTAKFNEADLLDRTKRSLAGAAVMGAIALFAFLAPHKTPTP